MVLRSNLRAKFPRRINSRIHIAAKPFLRRHERGDNVAERYVTDHQYIDVAVAPQLVASRRTENEGDFDLRRERRQRLADDVCNSSGLREKRLKFAEDWGSRVGLEVHLTTLDRTRDDAGGNQLVQFTLNRTNRQACLPGDLPQIKCLVGVAVEPSQYQPPDFPEEHRACIENRTHFSYNCTCFSYMFQSSRLTSRPGPRTAAASS